MRSIERKAHHSKAERISHGVLQRDLDNGGTNPNDRDSDRLDEQWGVPAPPDFFHFLRANQGSQAVS